VKKYAAKEKQGEKARYEIKGGNQKWL